MKINPLGTALFLIHAAGLYTLGSITDFGVREMGGEAFYFPLMLFDFPVLLLQAGLILVLNPVAKFVPSLSSFNLGWDVFSQITEALLVFMGIKTGHEQLTTFVWFALLGGIQWYFIGWLISNPYKRKSSMG